MKGTHWSLGVSMQLLLKMEQILKFVSLVTMEKLIKSIPSKAASQKE